MVLLYYALVRASGKSGTTTTQEEFIVELELLKEDSIEDDLLIEGEYLSEKNMQELWNWSEFLGCKSKLFFFNHLFQYNILGFWCVR